MCRTFAAEKNKQAKIWHIYTNTIAIVAHMRTRLMSITTDIAKRKGMSITTDTAKRKGMSITTDTATRKVMSITTSTV